MAVNYTVQANVVDIRRDNPKQEDAFLVDTNVWYWLTYTKASNSAQPHQTRHYPAYIGKALSAKSQLHHCGLSLNELSHIIEGTERDIFRRSSPATNTKKFRHNFPAERNNVVAEIQTAWEQVETMSKSLDLTVNADLTDKALQRMATESLDGYDLFLLEAMSEAGIQNIITDDGDYATVPGIQLFTANKNVIKTARNQGKLVRR
ncbi:type II toxin-antitoxin system VapC family toxin [Candidatus Electrothrix sp.]|uniref:type II toxin-antitoxin system VapC family toxin n=1 Tax=Candidatus Electrothrix sp. TaxID=2170559 RepID=UPI0040568641